MLAEVDRLNGIYQTNLDAQKVTTLHGRAVLLDAHTADVGGQRISFDKLLIATGARPLVPDLPGAEHGITSNEVFHLEQLPKHAGDRGRRLYRQRIRGHLPRARLSR